MIPVVSLKRVISAILLTVSLVVLFAGVASAEDSASPLGYMPDSSTLAVYIPSAAYFEEILGPLQKNPTLKERTDFMAVTGDLPAKIGAEDPKSIVSFAKALGLDTTKPIALFLGKDSAGKLDAKAVLPVADEKITSEKLKQVMEGTPEEITIGEIKGYFNATQEIAYFIAKGSLFLGSNKEGLEQFSARLNTPASFAYTPSESRKEIAVISSFSKLQSLNLLPATTPGADMTGTYDFFHSFVEEIVLGIGVEEGEAYVRLMGQNPQGDVAPPATPLTLHKIYPAGAPIQINLRNNAALVNNINTLLAANPMISKNAMYVRLVSQILGDQMGIAIKGVANGIPDGIFAVTLSKPENLKALMGLAGMKGEPKYQHNNIPVFVMENVKDGVNIYIATAGSLLLISADEEMLKTALNGVSPDGAISASESQVDAKLLGRGANGFVSVDGSKIDPAQLATILPNVDLSKLTAALTIGSEKNWNIVRLSIPGGMEGVANLAGTFVK